LFNALTDYLFMHTKFFYSEVKIMNNIYTKLDFVMSLRKQKVEKGRYFRGALFCWCRRRQRKQIENEREMGCVGASGANIHTMWCWCAKKKKKLQN